MADRVGSGALRIRDHAAELNQVTFVVSHKTLVKIRGREPRLPFELSHHVVLLTADFNTAQVEPAKEDLHRVRNVFDADAERRGAAAIDADAQLGFVHLETHIHGLEIVHAANFVGDVLGDAVKHVEILILENQFELGLPETDLDGGRQVRDGDRPLDFREESLLHAARAEHNLLYRPLPLAQVLEPHENYSQVRLSGAVEPR